MSQPTLPNPAKWHRGTTLQQYWHLVPLQAVACKMQLPPNLAKPTYQRCRTGLSAEAEKEERKSRLKSRPNSKPAVTSFINCVCKTRRGTWQPALPNCYKRAASPADCVLSPPAVCTHQQRHLDTYKTTLQLTGRCWTWCDHHGGESILLIPPNACFDFPPNSSYFHFSCIT